MSEFVPRSEKDHPLLEERSEEALKAEKDFQEFDWHLYLARPSFVSTLIYYLEDYFDLEIDPNLLPDHPDKETVEEENLRKSVMNRLLREFAVYKHYWIKELERYNDEPSSQWPAWPYDDTSYTNALEVFYWHLNRQPRQPLNLTRTEPVETAKE